MRRLIPFVLFGFVAIKGVSAQDQPAESIYKNIKVLKGVPASTFMNTMFFQRYALGVSCNYCHVGAEWEKDDKPQKATARRMQQMVFEINNTHFAGKPVINCMTCHQGATKPIGDIVGKRLTIQEMLGPRAPAVPAPPLPSIDDVLAKYIAALGGRDALGKITNRVTKGNMITADGAIVPFEDTFTMATLGSHSIRHFSASLGDFITVFDGASGWNSDNRGVTEQRGEARAQLEMNAKFENRLALAGLYTQLSVVGTESIAGALAYVMSGTSTVTGRRERLDFDAATGLLVRRTVIAESIFGSYGTDTYFENYRLVDGVQVPTIVSEFTPDYGTVRKATSVEHNASIERSLFAKPGARR